MAFITADRVLDSSTSTGTGAFVVSGTPAAGYRTFSAVMSVGDTCYYSIQGQTTSEWEVGLGTYSSANTLTRTTVYSSSNAGSAVTFSAGTKNIFITMVASKSPQLDPTGNVTALGTPASATLTNATGLSLTTGVTGVLPPANGGSLAWQSVQTGSFTAVAGNAYPVNTTSGTRTVTLPASPTAGQVVQITDYAGMFATNNCTINPNGGKINGASTNVVLSISRESVAFVYIDATQGWITYAVSVTNITSPYTASYLNVAGGGGGGGGTAYVGGGGGGAGGLLSGTTTFTPGTVYTIVIGAGGAGGATGSSWVGTSGSASSITSLTSTVGGGGGGGSATTITGGLSGGSGGGSAGGVAGGAGTSGQGNAGGGTSGPATAYGSNGGGGAGAVGGTPTSTTGGSGGIGTTNSLITTAQATSASVGQVVSSSIYYAGGGGGGVYANTPGTGGSGGGGAGTLPNTIATAGTVNSGGGGGGTGGGGSSANTVGGAGGSGVVLISVPTVNYSGAYTGTPTVVTNGSNTVLIFKSSGSYTA